MTVEPIRILMAEDDPEDQMFVRKAFREARSINVLACVNDGEELLQYLRRQGKYAKAAPPDVLLLDLNMPKMDGMEALKEIKSDPDLKSIPVVILTTSAADEDIIRSYDLGASSYIQKPVTFEKMLEVVETIGKYWLGIVKLPPNGENGERR
jgi:CheY-like chemotaxis protein